MIDRLELSVPALTPQKPQFWSNYQPRRATKKSGYVWTVDAARDMHLRVHGGQKGALRSVVPHYKVEFVRTRLLSANDLQWRVQQLFDTANENILSFRVTRIDFAADIRGVSVEWFNCNCRVRNKRISRRYESQWTDVRNGLGTLYFGSHADLYRIYNKVAEKRSKGEELGFWPWDKGSRVITRIERQCTGRIVPKKLSTLGTFLSNVVRYDPFQRLVCAPNTGSPPAMEEWEPRRWLMNLGLARAVHQQGEAAVRTRLNKTRNAKRFFDHYADLLRGGDQGPSRQDLVELYRSSTRKQLNIPERDQNGNVTYPLGGQCWLL